MEIEVGKTYRTRGGRRATITQITTERDYPVYGSVDGCEYVLAWGKDFSLVRGVVGALDLIAECPNEPEWGKWHGAGFLRDNDVLERIEPGCLQLLMPDDTKIVINKFSDLPKGHITAYRICKLKREPVRETHTGECWAYHSTGLVPYMCSASLGENRYHGKWTCDHVDGKPVRIVWEADT